MTMRFAINHSTVATSSHRRRVAFTLVEMVVVIAVILILVGISLPAMSTLWEGRKVSEAENTIRGVLTTTRARALQAGGVESGLFFFVDTDGVQRVVSIEQQPGEDVSDIVVWQNVFAITGDRDYSLPAPFRVVPRYAVDEESFGEPFVAFSPAELADNDVLKVVGQSAQRHRNFFTIVFSGEGQMNIRRDVLIQDLDQDMDGIGDVTGLQVGTGIPGTPPMPVSSYFQQDDSIVSLDPLGTNTTVPLLITDSDAAINFPSVDGLLVYDDSLFNEAGDGAAATDQQRAFLLRSAKPFYINRWTGAVIRGPSGETITP